MTAPWTLSKIYEIATRMLAEPPDGDTAPLVEICTLIEALWQGKPAPWTPRERALRAALEKVNNELCVTSPLAIARGVAKAFSVINAALSDQPPPDPRNAALAVSEEALEYAKERGDNSRFRLMSTDAIAATARAEKAEAALAAHVAETLADNQVIIDSLNRNTDGKLVNGIHHTIAKALADATAMAAHVERRKGRTTVTEAQQKAILEVCRNLISTGIAFGYQKDRTEPEYPAERGLAEIVRILAAPDAGKGAGDAT